MVGFLMPNRIIRAGINRSDRVNSLSWQAEVFYRRLLNEVDDYGLYDGRLTILRAQLYAACLDRVREADIDRWLAECEKATLVRLYEAEGKPYVFVLNTGWAVRSEPKFPLPKELHNSANNGAQLRPYSNAETYSKTKTKAGRPPPYLFAPEDIPPHFAGDSEFVDLWAQFIAHRLEMRKPLTERAAKMNLARISGWGCEGAKASIESSIANNWQGLFPPDRAVKKQIEPGDNGFIRKQDTDEELRELIGGNGGPP